MPDAARKSLSVLNDVFEKVQGRYEKEHTDKSFVKWVSEYLLINLEKDEFLSQYAPYLHKIGITDNVLYLKDTKQDKVVEIRMKDGVIQANDDDPIYLQFAMALPELGKLKDNS